MGVEPGRVAPKYEKDEHELESIRKSLQGDMKEFMDESAPKGYPKSAPEEYSGKKYLKSISANDEPNNALLLVSLKK